MPDVTRWQLWTHAVNITKANFASVTIDPSFVWTVKDKEGKTEWEKLQKLAADGWELISVTPIASVTSLGHTTTLLYTFKRPLP
jgi:hypothetical protein